MKNFIQTKKHLSLWLALLLLGGISVGLAMSGGLYGINLKRTPPEEGRSMVPKPVFTQPGGFYEEPFSLEIAAPLGTRVYYTLDCTEPTQSSQPYTVPIPMEDATPEENRFSMNTDVSTAFYGGNEPGYRAPDFPVDKCTVVRARAYSPFGQVSGVATAVYFVGMDAQRYDNCYIASLVTEPDNLFDPAFGIYTAGALFQNSDRSDQPDWRWWEANYRQKGRDWERPALLTMFSPQGEPLLEQPCGIRVQGGVSRASLPKSLNLYARREYDGSHRLNYDFFGSGTCPDTVTLSSGGNQTITQFNDVMMSRRVSGLDVTTMEYRPCVLFLDGEYWGFYWLASKYDEEYLSHRFGVEPDNTVIVKSGDIEYDYVREDMMYALQADHADEAEQLANLDKVTVLSSLTDYYATMIYIARQEDWPVGNTALWRTKTVREDPYSDRRWRYILFDCNSRSMTEADIDHNTLRYVCEDDEIFAALWENSLFREQFRQRLLEIAGECFDGGEMAALVEEYRSTMEQPLQKSWNRFYGKDNQKREEFHRLMDGHKAFFTQRRAVVEQWFE